MLSTTSPTIQPPNLSTRSSTSYRTCLKLWGWSCWPILQPVRSCFWAQLIEHLVFSRSFDRAANGPPTAFGSMSCLGGCRHSLGASSAFVGTRRFRKRGIWPLIEILHSARRLAMIVKSSSRCWEVSVGGRVCTRPLHLPLLGLSPLAGPSSRPWSLQSLYRLQSEVERDESAIASLRVGFERGVGGGRRRSSRRRRSWRGRVGGREVYLLGWMC